MELAWRVAACLGVNIEYGIPYIHQSLPFYFCYTLATWEGKPNERLASLGQYGRCYGKG
jgi:hypothetical protein